jgi:hypothetical protein
MTEATVVSTQCFPHGLPLIQTHRSTHRSIGIGVLIAWQQARLLWKENDRNRHRWNHYSTFDMGARHPQFDEFFMSQPPAWDGSLAESKLIKHPNLDQTWRGRQFYRRRRYIPWLQTNSSLVH